MYNDVKFKNDYIHNHQFFRAYVSLVLIASRQSLLHMHPFLLTGTWFQNQATARSGSLHIAHATVARPQTEPRKKKRPYFPLNPDWFIEIFILVHLKNPHNSWVV